MAESQNPTIPDTGCLVALSYRIMAENPVISTKLGMVESPETANDIRHGPYFTTLVLINGIFERNNKCI